MKNALVLLLTIASLAMGSGSSGAGGTGNSWSDPVDSSLIPDTDDTYDIGSSTYQFNDVYNSGTVYNKVADDGVAVGADTSTKFMQLEVGGTGGWIAMRRPNNTATGMQWNESTDADGARQFFLWSGSASTSYFQWEANANTRQMRLTNGTLSVGNATTAAVSFNAAAAGSGSILMGVTDGNLAIAGGTSVTTPANILLYGSTHATQANDFYLRSATTSIIAWDDSANTLSLGKDSSTVLTLKGTTEAVGPSTATLTNAPAGAAGNPDVWMKVSYNGTTYIFPGWTP